jgi:hypothetical protein
VEGKDTIITLEESLVSICIACMYVCILSGSKNHIELENSCGFIEPPPGKKYKKRSDVPVDKHAVYKELSNIIWWWWWGGREAIDSQYLENMWPAGFEISIIGDYSPLQH